MSKGKSELKKKWPAQEVKMRSVKELLPYARNSKRHPENQIKLIMASIKEWGWTIPVLIDEKDEVVAGHGRLAAAVQLGLDEIPCMLASGWTDAQKKAYRIADNRLTELGDWDEEMLKVELAEIRDLGFDVEFTGFDLGAQEWGGTSLEDLDLGDGEIAEKPDMVKIQVFLPAERARQLKQELREIVEPAGGVIVA